VPEEQQDRSNSGEAEKKTTLSSGESEVHYRRLFETAQDGILMIDFDSERIIDANPFLTQLLGYPHDELVGKTLWEIGPFSDIVQSKTAFDELKRKGSVRYGDLPLETKDGRQRRVEFVSNVYALDGARVIQFNVRDMTERKQAEEAMRRQTNLLQKTFDSMTDAVFILDAKLPAPTITECNQAACTVFRYDRTEMLGKSTQFLHVSDETLKEFQSLLNSAVKEGRLPFHLAEFHMKRKNGTVFPSEHTVSQLTNDKGERTAWVSIVRDMTERKRMEEVLRESEERYRLLFEKSPVGIGLSSVDGKVLAANETMLAITGYSLEELKRINLADTYDNKADRKTLLESLNRAGSIADYPARLRRKDGTSYEALLSISRVQIAGEEFVQTTCVDVTERKRMEKEIRSLAEFPSENPSPMVRLDKKGTVLVANRASKTLLQEWSCEPGQTAPEFWCNLVAEALSTGQSRNLDIELGNRCYTFLVKPIVEAGYVNFYGQDITDRKRAEEALRESEERYRSLFDSTNDAIFIHDMGRRFLEVNKVLCELLGYSREELLQMTPADISSPEYASQVVPRLAELRQVGHAFFESAYVRRDGTIIPIELSARIIEFKGKPAVLSVARGITERKRMEDELRRLSQFRESVIDNAHIWIDVLDEKANVVVWNKAAEAISGYSREEVIGHDKIWEWLYPDEEYRRYLTGLVADVIQHGRVEEDFETTIRRKDGKIKTISWNERSLMDEHGKVIGSIALGRDVTEHKKMEDELRESQAEYKSLFEDSPTPLWLEDQSEVKKSLDHLKNSGVTDFAEYFQSHPEVVRELLSKVKILDVNRATSRLYEAPNREAYQEGLARLFTEEAFDSFRKQLVEMTEGSIQFQNEYTALTFSGDKKRISLTWSVAPGYEKSFSRVFVSTIDITELKRMEDELRQYSTKLEQLVAERTRELTASKDFAENLIQTANAMVVGLDIHGNVRFLNQAAERITGYTSRELEGRNWFEVIVPKDRYPEVWREFERLTAGGLPRNFENPIVTKSGEERYVVWQNNEVRGQGQIVRRISFGIDISERKRAEEQLRATRERLEYVISSNPAVIFTGKPRADLPDYDATYMSRRVVELTGFDSEEFINHPEIWEHRVKPNDYRSYLASLPRFWKTGHLDVEYRFLRKDGRERWLREEARLVRDEAGKPLEVIGYLTDVSERKRLEEELAKAHQLAAIGETSAMIGHDLRNPLQGIAGIVYLAKKNFESRKAADKKVAAALLDTIEEQVMYMDKIVSDLQDYAQPLAPQLTETNLPNLIRQTLSTIKIPETVKVSVRTGEFANNAMVDSTLMRRTLTNLTINAIQAMPKRGKLTIRARSRGDSIILTVEDTGVGIPRKNLAKIFNPFFTTKARGQGLGLAVCKRLVEAQGGTITVKSKPRKGTAFTIKLRRGKKEVASQVGEEEHLSHRR
jgi:PAS domain S-box-containing protein